MFIDEARLMCYHIFYQNNPIVNTEKFLLMALNMAIIIIVSFCYCLIKNTDIEEYIYVQRYFRYIRIKRYVMYKGI